MELYIYQTWLVVWFWTLVFLCLVWEMSSSLEFSLSELLFCFSFIYDYFITETFRSWFKFILKKDFTENITTSSFSLHSFYHWEKYLIISLSSKKIHSEKQPKSNFHLIFNNPHWDFIPVLLLQCFWSKRISRNDKTVSKSRKMYPSICDRVINS